MGSSGKAGTTLTTKGDLQGFSTLAARVPVGSDGQVLTARSTATNGVDWEGASSLGQFNESQAAVLTNATSAGDAGGRADHFAGAALSGNWTVVSGTATVAYSVMQVGSGGGHFYQAYTPSGALDVHWKMSNPPTSGGALLCGLVDTGTFGTNQNGVGIGIQCNGGSDPYLLCLKWVNGTQTILSQTGMHNLIGPWNYLRLTRDGSNNYTYYWSVDRVNWVQMNTLAQTNTLARIFLRFSGTAGSFDFVDIVS